MSGGKHILHTVNTWWIVSYSFVDMFPRPYTYSRDPMGMVFFLTSVCAVSKKIVLYFIGGFSFPHINNHNSI